MSTKQDHSGHLESTPRSLSPRISFPQTGVDAKSTPAYSSDLHFSVYQDRSERGLLIGSKICLKRSKIGKRADNGGYNGQAYFSSIFYAPCITKLGFFFNLGPILSSQVRQLHFINKICQVRGISGGAFIICRNGFSLRREISEISSFVRII